MRMASLLILTIVCGGTIAHADDPAPGSEPMKGQPYPALRLPTIDGKQTIDLRSYRGQKLVLIEFASW